MRISALLLSTMVIATALLLSLPAAAAEGGLPGNSQQTVNVNQVSTGLQTWILHSKSISGRYVMDQGTSGTANNGTDEKVSVSSGASAIWVSDKSVIADTAYSSGWWYIDIFTSSSWGTNGTTCHVDVGIWNGTVFIPFTIKTGSSFFFSSYPMFDLRQMLYQTSSQIIHPGEFLAIQITNYDTAVNDISTAESDIASKISGINEGSITIISPSPTATSAPILKPSPTLTVPIIPVPTPTSITSPLPFPAPTPTMTSGVTNFSTKVNTSNGIFNVSVTATSNDNKARVEIPAGIQGRTVPGSPVTSITILKVDNPGGVPPVGANFLVGNSFYKVEPSGAQFSKPVQITLPFDPALGDFPYIAYWEPLASPPQWQTLSPPFSIHTTDNTVTGNTGHFSFFTALALAPTTLNGSKVTLQGSIVPSTAINPSSQLTPSRSDTPESKSPSVPTARTSTSPAAPLPATNWGVIIGIIAAIIAVLLVVMILIRRR